MQHLLRKNATELQKLLYVHMYIWATEDLLYKSVKEFINA